MNKTYKHFFYSYAPSFLAVLIFGFIARNGLKMTNDSIEYVSAALSLFHKSELLHSDGQPFLQLSPLYPVLLSVFGDCVYAGAWWLQGFALFVAVRLWQHFSRFEGRLGVAFGLTLAFSVGMQTAATFLWTEVLFMAGWVGFLELLFFVFGRESVGGKYWVVSGFVLLAILLPLQRNAGIFLMMGIGLFFLKNDNKAFFRYVVLVLPSVVVFGVWSFYSQAAPLRNLSWMEAVSFFGDHFRLYGVVFWKWFGLGMFLPSDLLGIAFILAVGYGLVQRAAFNRAGLAVFLSGFYVVALVLFQTIFDVGQGADIERYLLPIFPLCVYWVLGAVLRRWGQQTAFLVCYILVAYSFLRLCWNLYRWEQLGL